VDKRHLKGIVVPLVTPFREDETVDEDALRALVRHLIECGVHGLFPIGSTGEFYAVTPDERRRILRLVVDEAGGCVPVYAGAGAVSTLECLAHARMAEEAGADCLVVVTPFYITPTIDELYEHYATIARATSLAVIPYNNPSRTGGVNMTPDLMARLAGIPNIMGIKDSSGNQAQTMEYVQKCGADFAVFQGRDDLIYPSLVTGAVGGVACVANVAPRAVVEVYDAYVRGDTVRALAVQRTASVLRQALALGTFPVVIKEAMAMVGLPGGHVRRPVRPLSPEKRVQLRAILRSIDLLDR
jgi:4-hydroxy-tetrahydrodipicolinate synthase